jgi:hypothetical protein
MKITYRNLGLLSIGFFILSIVVIGYLLYDMPANISTHIRATDKTQLATISSIVGRLGLVVSIGLANGLVAILFLILGSKGQNTQQVVYVTQRQEQQQSNVQQSEQDEEAKKLQQQQRFQRMEQQVHASGSKEIKQALEKALRAVCNELEACQGAVYLADEAEGKRFIELYAGYAFYLPESQRLTYEFGEGLAGQVAKEGKMINLTSVPDNYITVLSGLGKASPNHLIIAPIKDDNEPATNGILGIVEIASFTAFSAHEEELVRKAVAAIGKLIQEQIPNTASA